MKEKDSGQKAKRKILVEFTIPDEWEDVGDNFFSLYLPHNLAELESGDTELLFSGKIVSFSNSKNYDTIP